MKKIFFVFIIIPSILSAQFIRPKIIRGKGVFGESAASPWQGSWFGGSSPSAVKSADNDWIPTTLKQDKPLDLKTLKNPVVVFLNPIGLKKGSLKISYNATGGWASAIVAPGEPLGWAQIDVSECNTLMLEVKGETETENWKIKVKFDQLEGNEISLSSYLPAGKITKEWQRAVIPLSDLIDLSKANLTKFASLGGALSGNGDCTIYVDNIVFYKEDKPQQPKIEEQQQQQPEKEEPKE